MAPRKFLNKADILAMDDLKFKDIQIPEWGDMWVRVRTMSGSERDYFEASTIIRNGKQVETNLRGIRARLAIMTVIDPETGQRLFSEEDEYPLGAKSSAALDRIFAIAQELNGLRAADVDELAKNLPADQPEDSPSA